MPHATAIASTKSGHARREDTLSLPFVLGGSRRFTWDEMLATRVRWPQPSLLREPLDPKGAKMAEGLTALGLSTVGELLEHMPRDRREARTVETLQAGEQATVMVEVRSIVGRPVRRRGMRGLVEATVFDETGSMRATFFNQPWLVSRYPPGTRLVLHGKADTGGRFRVSHHALGADVGAEGELSQSRSVAHYPAAEGVSSTQILTLMHEHRHALNGIVEPLSASLRVTESLPSRTTALAAMHFGAHFDVSSQARKRLAFEELLLAQLVFLTRRERRTADASGLAMSDPPTLTKRWLEQSLPFQLTGDQRKAIATVTRELEDERPMQRLLMGEVGSGKTVVALYAMLRAVEHGAQAALMAPTETLAEQHFATVQRLLGAESVTLALLSGSTATSRRIDTLAKLASGELSLLIGTHALIEPDVRFRGLAVIVVDEQHRFGVRQRAALSDGQGDHALDPSTAGQRRVPHTLHMTATPIPRTLALARHGDLDRTVLRELPHERKAIQTHIVGGEKGREEAYKLLRKELGEGRQGYVVCPLVEEGEDTAASTSGDVRAATAEFERLRTGELAGFEVELLHGQMRPREKQAAMEAFVSGRAEVLVATTVIEVGVDVPNATVMLVENAERFGISQLHQLRGRIGRGEHASTCLLAGPPGSPRLRALVQHADGFKLAQIDLALRKEGELIGTRQSGLGQFKFASLPEDEELLERARAQAQEILESDPGLDGTLHTLLGEALKDAFGTEALRPIPA